MTQYSDQQKRALEQAFNYQQWRVVHPVLSDKDYERMAQTVTGAVALMSLIFNDVGRTIGKALEPVIKVIREHPEIVEQINKDKKTK